MAEHFALTEHIKKLMAYKNAALSGVLGAEPWRNLLDSEFYKQPDLLGAEGTLLLQKIWCAALFMRGGQTVTVLQQRFEHAVVAVAKWPRADFILAQAVLPFEIQVKVLQQWVATNQAGSATDFEAGLMQGVAYVDIGVLLGMPDVSHRPSDEFLQIRQDLQKNVEDVGHYLRAIIRDAKQIGRDKPKFLRSKADRLSEGHQVRRVSNRPVDSNDIGSENELVAGRLHQEDGVVAMHRQKAGVLLDGERMQRTQIQREKMIQGLADSIGDLQKNWQKETWIQDIQHQLQTAAPSRVDKKLVSEKIQTKVGPKDVGVSQKGVSPLPVPASGYSADEVIRRAKAQKKSQASI